MPATRARISTCRELSVWARYSNVIGTSRGSTFTAVTSIVWVVATLVSGFLQPTAKRIPASAQTSALVRGLKGIRFILDTSQAVSCGRMPWRDDFLLKVCEKRRSDGAPLQPR